MQQYSKRKFEYDRKRRQDSFSNLEISPETDKDSPAFVGKLFAMLEDRRAEEYISWSDSGDSIVIPDPTQFSSKILPM